MTRPLEDCCYRCTDCSRVVCRENETSPGEPRRCGDCHDRHQWEFADWLAGGWTA